MFGRVPTTERILRRIRLRLVRAAATEHSRSVANAIGTGLVDYVLPVAEMPARIVEYHDRLRRVVLAPAVMGTDDEAAAMREVMTLLRIRTGQDFSNYKPSTIQRRVLKQPFPGRRQRSLQKLSP